MNVNSLSYIVTSFAPPEINKRFSEAKKKFNSLIKQNKANKDNIITQNTAHITLQRAFYLKSRVEEKVVIKALNNINFSPISIFSDKLSIFHSEKLGNILVAVVKQTPELKQLHDQISEAIDQYIEYEKRRFIPHLSILYNLPDNKIKEARLYAQQNIIPFSYMLSNFNLLKDTGVIKERTIVELS